MLQKIISLLKISNMWPLLFGKSPKVQALENQLTAAVQENRFYKQTFGNHITQYPDWKTVGNADRYCTTDDIYSIINLISTTAASIPFYNYIKDSEGKLTDAKDTDELSIMLENPFEGMSKFESFYAICATILMQGECIMWKFKPENGPNKGKVSKLFYMAPQNVNIKVTTTFPRKIVAYQYVEEGQVVMDDIPPEEIIHIKYFNPQHGISGAELRGLSPLRILSKRNTQADSIISVTTAQLQNGGVPGILTEKGDYAEIKENSDRRKADMYKWFNEPSNKGMPYPAGGDLEYIALGLKLADMEVADLEKITFKKFCNVFCVSDRLFNNDATGSEISDDNARVGLYTNAVLPLLKRVRDSLNNKLVPEFKGNKYYINFDVSEIQELQKHYSSLVTWLAAAWWLSPNQKLEQMGWEKSEDPLFDMCFIPAGLQLANDLLLPDPEALPNTGDYD